MRKIIEPFDNEAAFPRAVREYTDGMSFAVTDIETLGLSPAYDPVILVGMMICGRDERTLVQYFAETPGDERDVLEAAAEQLAKCDFVVTYNGRFFDMPFLEKRSRKYGVSVPKLYDLDIFTVLKYYSDLPNTIGSMSQKNVERFAGISDDRTDEISGGESISMYDEYVRCGSKECENKILLHNADDVRQLYSLIPVLRYADIDRAFARSGFPVRGGAVKKVDVKRGEIIVRGITRKPGNYIKFPSAEEPFLFKRSAGDNSFEISIPCEMRDGSMFFDTSFAPECAIQAASEFPEFASGYLIVKEGSTTNYAGLNAFLRKFVPGLLTL
ncbi:MAG: ribonuclease H-like domain-containing protein [Eubacterium sp.]|jgi:uncharacterized protein YprB with RNaseH-like and TPR domain